MVTGKVEVVVAGGMCAKAEADNTIQPLSTAMYDEMISPAKAPFLVPLSKAH